VLGVFGGVGVLVVRSYRFAYKKGVVL